LIWEYILCLNPFKKREKQLGDDYSQLS